jgi:hypothetical protein
LECGEICGANPPQPAAALQTTHPSAVRWALGSLGTLLAGHLPEEAERSVLLHRLDDGRKVGAVACKRVLDSRLQRNGQSKQVVDAAAAQPGVMHGERSAAPNLQRRPGRRPGEEPLQPTSADFGRGLAPPSGRLRTFAKTRDEKPRPNDIFNPLAHRPNSLLA